MQPIATPPYKESLPAQCPPPEAGPLQPMSLLRLIGPNDLCEGDFASHAALGVPCHMPDKACEWASCSMFLPSLEKHKLVALTKFKRLKSKNAVAYVAVGPAAGIARISTTKHVDLWMYADYSPLENTSHVVKLDDYEAA